MWEGLREGKKQDNPDLGIHRYPAHQRGIRYRARDDLRLSQLRFQVSWPGRFLDVRYADHKHATYDCSYFRRFHLPAARRTYRASAVTHSLSVFLLTRPHETRSQLLVGTAAVL
jgi:hypothetical protein